jgi:hypothetical protein
MYVKNGPKYPLFNMHQKEWVFSTDKCLFSLSLKGCGAE